MSEPCAVCGEDTEMVLHEFFEGTKERPVRKWAYWAALYHHPTTREPYCGPHCASQALAAPRSGSH